MSTTNVNGYCLPIEDISISQKFGSKVSNVADVATATTNVAAAGTVTAAQLLNGYLTVGIGAGGGYNTTTPTGTLISGAITAKTGIVPAAGTSFSVMINNTVAQIMTLLAGADVTVVGTATLAASSATQAVFICTAANTWKVFLVSNT